MAGGLNIGERIDCHVSEPLGDCASAVCCATSPFSRIVSDHSGQWTRTPMSSKGVEDRDRVMTVRCYVGGK